jgi:hypothetical protein
MKVSIYHFYQPQLEQLLGGHWSLCLWLFSRRPQSVPLLLVRFTIVKDQEKGALFGSTMSIHVCMSIRFITNAQSRDRHMHTVLSIVPCQDAVFVRDREDL